MLAGGNHGTAISDVPMYYQPYTSKGISIGDDVWIGANSVIVDGVSVGSGSIIAAGSIVIKDVEPLSLVAGNPAKFIKHRQQ